MSLDKRLSAIISLLTVMVFLLPTPARGKATETPDTISPTRAFLDLPETTIELLSRNTRLDMLDYYKAGSASKATNNLKGKSYIKTMTPDFLEASLSPSSDMQFKTLKGKDGKEVVMVITTIGEEGDIRDSDVEFYDPALSLLESKRYFKYPKLADFVEIPKGYKTSVREIDEMLPFYTISLEASPENSNLVARIHLGEVLTIEDAKLLEMFLKPQITYIWNGKQYKK